MTWSKLFLGIVTHIQLGLCGYTHIHTGFVGDYGVKTMKRTKKIVWLRDMNEPVSLNKKKKKITPTKTVC